jgi:DNA processing protein
VAERNFTVVSGAAFGIDAAAHEGALAVDGVTVAVLAGGIDRPYPVAHTALLERIARTGAVVSQVPPGWSPTRWRFLSRNRLIATMTQGTVVVEAGLRSGSRNTARHARAAGRHLAAVPGPVTSAVSAGCHEEIRAEATLVTDAAEIVELLGRIGELAPVKRAPRRPEDDLDPDHARVLECLQSTRTLDAGTLAERVGLGTSAVRTALGVLQLEGLCHPVRGGWRRVRRSDDGP